MPEHTSILNLILRSIFVGFGFVVPVAALLKTSNLDKLRFKELFILTGVQAVRLGGILYFLMFLIQTYFNWDYVKLYGSNQLYYWYSPIMYLLISQLFWIKALYTKRYTLVAIAVLMLLLPSAKLLLLVGSMQRDYLPATWSMYSMDPFIELPLNIIVFIFIIITIMLAGGKFKKIKE